MLRPYLVERPHPVQDDVGVCRHRLPEDPTLTVPGTPGPRARGRLQVVNEPPHDATFDESQRPGGPDPTIQGPIPDTPATQGTVGGGERRLEHRPPDLPPPRGKALSNGP